MNSLNATVSRCAPLAVRIASGLPGWLIAYSVGSTAFADVAALIGFAIAVRWIWAHTGNPYEMCRLARVGAIVLIGTLNGSWLVASTIHRLFIDTSIADTLAREDLTVSYYALGMFYASVFAFALAVLGSSRQLAKLEGSCVATLSELVQASPTRVGTVLFCLAMFGTLLIASGMVGHRTLVVEGVSEGKLPFWMAFYDAMPPLQLALNGLLTAQLAKRRKPRQDTVLLIILLISVLVVESLYINMGRTPFVFSIIASIFWVTFFLRWSPTVTTALIGLAALLPFIAHALLFSNFIRSGDAGLKEWRTSAIEVVPLAWRRYRESAHLRRAEVERSTLNLSSRPLVVSSLARCLQVKPQHKSFASGRVLLHALIWAMPSNVLVDKFAYANQEVLLYQYFPVGDADAADSLYWSAYVDFGWLGLLVYSAFAVVVWWGILMLMSVVRVPKEFVLLIVSSWLPQFIVSLGEGSVTGWFIAVRSGFIWIILGAVLAYVRRR